MAIQYSTKEAEIKNTRQKLLIVNCYLADLNNITSYQDSNLESERHPDHYRGYKVIRSMIAEADTKRCFISTPS